MHTIFTLQPLQRNEDFDIDWFQHSLPAGFLVEDRIDEICLRVETPVEEDERAQYLVDREVDRLFYLTGVRFRAEMCRRSLSVEFKASLTTYVRPSTNIGPLGWTHQLAIQLRLWAIAAEVLDPFTRILLLFQIIELSHPNDNDYHPYTDSMIAPQPLRECKMLRNLVAHTGDVSLGGLKKYCTYLGPHDRMLDRTDLSQGNTIASRMHIVETEARRCLQSAA